MFNLPYFHPHCKTWTEQKALNICQEIEECPYCSAIHSLKYESMAPVWCWDLELPADWLLPQWESVRLFPIHVNQPVLCCNQCGEHTKIIPSFIQQGTTLTLPALIFVAFAYEFSDLTWRELPQMFCAEENRIAHSTLYKAVHGLGQLMQTDSEFRQLCLQSLPTLKSVPSWPIPHWPPPKSIYIHTVLREKGVRLLIRTLRSFSQHLLEVFDRFVIALERVFVNSNQQVPLLYKNDQLENTTLNTA